MNKLLRVFAVLFLLAFWNIGCGKKAQTQSAGGTDYESLRSELVKRIQSGALTPDAAGAVEVPQDLKSASSMGKVVVGNDTAAGFMVLMNASPGGQGWLYTEKPVSLQTKFTMGQFSVTVVSKSNEHWYGVFCM